MSHALSNDCIFCRIVKKDIPSSLVYEDDTFFAFLDTNPINPGHVLVIPKRHYESFLVLPKSVLEKYLGVVQRVAQAVSLALDAEGFNVIQNNGKVAGQSVFHVHFHIVPRFRSDGFELWNGTPYAEGEISEYAQKIMSAL